MNSRPVWRLPYTYPKQQISEMINEIMSGTFTLSIDMRREILIQARERGLINFNGEDRDAYSLTIDKVVIIPQLEIQQRSKH